MSTEQQNSTRAGAPGLQVDREIDAIIETYVGAGEPDALEALAEHLYGTLRGDDADRYLFGVARRLRGLVRASDELGEYRAAVMGEIDAEQQRIDEQREALEAVIRRAVIQRRDDGKGKTLTIPGVGRWSSRTVPAGFRVAKAEVVDALTGDERQQYVEQVQVDQLRVDEFRKHVQAVIDDLSASVHAEVLPTALAMAEGDEAAAQRIIDAAIDDALEADGTLPDGVTYRRASVSVTYEFAMLDREV